ncbi:MAG: hypothetical protein QXX95_06035 [Nitrososphaerales archaeon]
MAIVTLDGRAYYQISKLLRKFGIPYQEFSPEDPLPSSVKVVITTKKEKDKIPLKEVLCLEDFFGKELKLMQKLLAYEVGKRGKLIIGIDPGLRIGFTSYYNYREIYSSILNSLDELILRLEQIFEAFKGSKLVRIGDGNPKLAREIAKTLAKRFKVNIEIVNEKGTTLLAKNKGKAFLDKYSAKLIAFREGKRFNL